MGDLSVAVVRTVMMSPTCTVHGDTCATLPEFTKHGLKGAGPAGAGPATVVGAGAPPPLTGAPGRQSTVKRPMSPCPMPLVSNGKRSHDPPLPMHSCCGTVTE